MLHQINLLFRRFLTDARQLFRFFVIVNLIPCILLVFTEPYSFMGKVILVTFPTYYHTMKYADLECGANGYGGNNWIVLRYADVALMLAEAYYWQGVSPTAETYLNMVRRRAGLADWSGSDLRQGIYDERLFEFIQEGLRWQDVLRMYSNEEMIEHYNAVNSNFSVKDLLLPIPYNERILNPEGLYQNPGYGVE